MIKKINDHGLELLVDDNNDNFRSGSEIGLDFFLMIVGFGYIGKKKVQTKAVIPKTLEIKNNPKYPQLFKIIFEKIHIKRLFGISAEKNNP